MEEVDTFKYIRANLDNKGYLDSEINARVESASEMYHSLCNGFISKNLWQKKMCVFKSV